MDQVLISVDYKDPAWIAIAFAFGLLMKQVRLPPMVGFLIAGFILNLLGAESGRFLLDIADLGVTLLLFTIGLKLRVGTLVRPEIWATTGLHMTGMIVVTTGILLLLAQSGWSLFGGLTLTTALIVAFALSFSSTVFAVKTLEDRGAVLARYGQVAIGVLVIQDVAAVVFLAFSSGKLPSLWALALLLLIPGRYLLTYILERSGHKELLIVYGFVLALGGAAIFELVGMKGDLGALFVGVLLAHHPKADELSKDLLGFKDVFLVCFFLSIGLTGLPTLEIIAVALLLMVLVPFKGAMYFILLTRFRMRARASTFGALVLGNYSEFGLIVAAIAIGSGWLPDEWMTTIALALSMSFVVASPLNVHADALFRRNVSFLRRFEQRRRLPGDEDIEIGDHRIIIFGMGRVGGAAYDEMVEHAKGRILGIDLDEERVTYNTEAGRQVVLGDATNAEFWVRLQGGHEKIEMILLAMANHTANIDAARHLRGRGYSGPIVATALYPDQEADLKENGIDEVYNIYAEAGSATAARMAETMRL